jgi:hypothetical protein
MECFLPTVPAVPCTFTAATSSTRSSETWWPSTASTGRTASSSSDQVWAVDRGQLQFRPFVVSFDPQVSQFRPLGLHLTARSRGDVTPQGWCCSRGVRLAPWGKGALQGKGGPKGWIASVCPLCSSGHSLFTRGSKGIKGSSSPLGPNTGANSCCKLWSHNSFNMSSTPGVNFWPFFTHRGKLVLKTGLTAVHGTVKETSFVIVCS